MKTIINTAFLAAAAVGLLAAPAIEAKPRLTGEEKLAKMLEGREAGEPRSCIATFDSNSLQIIDKTALVYRSGKTIWVSRPADPDSLDDSDILVIKRFSGSQLCKLDMLHTVSRTGGFYTGNVMLGDFVPYTKVDKAEG
ncbi:MAG: hypothetical protein IE933_14415 [Sphingomonadales bacterium]|nr:hypothetical protein [Sphingomonadales bacterium]MBD3775404.1 hypothetical protein [Paracoccaceae bacterium]